MVKERSYLKGRGAQLNPTGRFEKYIYDEDPQSYIEEEDNQLSTEYINVHPKTIVNKVDSPDIPMNWSINPYQGCEHGCIYCYARNTHAYWGFGPGLDFEQKIMVKNNAAALLEAKLKKKSWVAAPIMLSGNTDCYQPIERKLKITRGLLEVFLRYRHPVGIITKNSLVLRDLDILKQLNEHGLVHVAISLTTLDDHLRQFMEPRTATVKGRLKAIETLSKAGIPVTVMMAPIIPGLNEHEILPLLKEAARVGALSAGYTMVRLNGEIGRLFEDWLRRFYPDRADKVLNKIRSCHTGALSDSRFKVRMRGEGNIALIINEQFKLAKRKYFADNFIPPLNTTIHIDFKSPQLNLFR